MRRGPRRRLYAACVIAVAWCLGALLLVFWISRLEITPWPDKKGLNDQSEVREKGSVLIQQIEAYRAANGRYPKSLATSGITPPAISWGTGQWLYELDGDSYYITVPWTSDGYPCYTYTSRRGGYWSLDK